MSEAFSRPASSPCTPTAPCAVPAAQLPAGLLAALCAKPGAVQDYKPEWDWDRWQVGGKMFAALCCPGPTHAAAYAGRMMLTLKCDPAEADFLRRQFADVLPGFYMDKRNWISIRLDGDFPDGELLRLCEASYQLVFSRLTKKCQREIAAHAG